MKIYTYNELSDKSKEVAKDTVIETMSCPLIDMGMSDEEALNHLGTQTFEVLLKFYTENIGMAFTVEGYPTERI